MNAGFPASYVRSLQFLLNLQPQGQGCIHDSSSQLLVEGGQSIHQRLQWPWVQKWVKALSDAQTLEALEALTSNAKYREGLEKLKGRNDARGQELQAIASKRAAELSEVAAQPEDDMVPA